jgi:hypothetical protein
MDSYVPKFRFSAFLIATARGCPTGASPSLLATFFQAFEKLFRVENPRIRKLFWRLF